MIATGVLAVSMALNGCDKSSTIGGDLVSHEVTIIVDSSFTVTGQSVRTEAVLSRTVTQLMGVIDVPEFGYMRSDVVTQFMPASAIDTTGVSTADIDSVKMVMLVNTNGFVGDSLALMGIEIYPLIKQLTTPMYSNFNPEGYYDANTLLGSTVYNLAKESLPKKLQGQSYYTLNVDLPIELGHKFFNEYVEHPSTYASPTAFSKFFPGVYMRNSYGSGRMTRIGNTTIQMYYHQNTVNDNGNDTTIYKTGSYFAVTPEIITNNDIELTLSDDVEQRVKGGESILLAPAGLEVEFVFPGREIISSYEKGTAGGLGVVNRLTLSLPVETIENQYDITAPSDVLMVLKKDRDSFFLENKLPDDVTSFRATLTKTGANSYAYVFPNMRQYLLDLMSKETVTDEDVTFMLVPVTATEESNSDYYGGSSLTLTAITPYITEPKMCKIVFNNAKINFVYSIQEVN